MRRLSRAALFLLALSAGHARAAEGPDQHKPAEIVGRTTKTNKNGKANAKAKGKTKPVVRSVVLLPARVAAVQSSELADEQRSLDDLLENTVQDLGMRVSRPRKGDEAVDEIGLPALAESRGQLVLLPLLSMSNNELELRVIAARPGSHVVSTRVERIQRDDLAVRAVVMLRDVVRASWAKPPARATRPRATPTVKPARSAGRAILAVNGTAYGGFIGFSLQRASGSDDPRLLYPLLGVGAGIGLGAAIIVADEWDVGVGDAWYLAAGAWWPAVAGHLVYEGRFGDTPTASADEAWSFGLIASTTGFGLSAVGLLSRGMGDGGAVLAHSGGALGLIVGGLTEFAVTGVSDEVPFAGMGYGAATGWLLASTTAIHFHPDAIRTLTIDLGIALGGLAGASAASPLLFEEPSPDKTRGWVAATGGGLIAGGVLAWWLSRPDDASEARAPAWLRYAIPRPTLVGVRPSVGEIGAPGPGLELSGDLP
jgi:hypothetical protein